MDPQKENGFAAAEERQSFVRHELRTPLAVMQPLLGMLLDGAAGALDEKQLGYVRMLDRNVVRLAAMIVSVVESGWLEAAAHPERPGTIDVPELIGTAVARARASLDGGPPVDVRLGDGLPHLRGDSYRLQHALHNVLVNACAFTPPSGRVTVSASRAERDGWVVVRVDDTGCGIPADEIDAVFDFGFQGRAGRDREDRGLGLGLAIARDFVEAHGGAISVQSAENEGTRVCIELPGAFSERTTEAPAKR